MSRKEFQFSQFLSRSNELAIFDPAGIYQEVTVKLWGKGVVRRGLVRGAELAGNRRFIARAGHFILSKIDARNGASGLVPPTLEGAVVTNDFPLFQVDRSIVDLRYLELLSRTPAFIDLCRRSSEGTTNRVRLDEDKFLALKVRLPSVGEQKRVVDRVDSVARKLLEADTIRTEQRRLTEQLIASAFDDISRGAPLKKMSLVAPIVRRPVEISFDTTYPELGIRSFFKGTFHKPSLSALELGSKRLFSILPGDLIFSNVFAWEGAVAIASPNDAGRYGSHRFITCAVDEDVANAAYLLQYFRTEEGFEKIKEASPGGAGRNRTLGIEALGEIQVPMPPVELQRKFAGLHQKASTLFQVFEESSALYGILTPSILEREFDKCFENQRTKRPDSDVASAAA